MSTCRSMTAAGRAPQLGKREIAATRPPRETAGCDWPRSSERWRTAGPCWGSCPSACSRRRSGRSASTTATRLAVLDGLHRGPFAARAAADHDDVEMLRGRCGRQGRRSEVGGRKAVQRPVNLSTDFIDNRVICDFSLCANLHRHFISPQEAHSDQRVSIGFVYENMATVPSHTTAASYYVK